MFHFIHFHDNFIRLVHLKGKVNSKIGRKWPLFKKMKPFSMTAISTTTNAAGFQIRKKQQDFFAKLWLGCPTKKLSHVQAKQTR